ncbi:hypothetical protein Ddep01_01823 [Deinococcus depolymerans]
MPRTPHQPLTPAQEPLRRRVYLLLCLLAGLALMTMLLSDLRAGQSPSATTAAGMTLCLGAAALLQFSRIPWVLVDYCVLLAATGIGLLELGQAAGRDQPMPPRTYFTGVFLVIAAFSILPTRGALTYTAALLACFAALSLRGGSDPVLLGELTLSALLIAHLSYFGRQVSAERARSEVQYRLSRTDPLTGLENRRGMFERIQDLFGAQARGESGAFTVLLADIDHFKRVNDSFGHDVGDRVLAHAALTLGRAVGSQGTVARWGGEEFLVLLTTARPAAVRTVAGQVWHAARRGGPDLPAVTLSVGGASSAEVTTVSELLRLADVRLYEAKARGRDRVRLGPLPTAAVHAGPPSAWPGAAQETGQQQRGGAHQTGAQAEPQAARAEPQPESQEGAAAQPHDPVGHQ